MKYLSEKITDYVIKTGAASDESYAIYQYGFQIGLEMVSCFLTCFCIAIWLHMIPEFVVFTIVFMLLRTYAGGLHLNRFGACFLCSVSVQTLILVINSKFTFPVICSWICIVVGLSMVWMLAPVENINRELDQNEKEHCKKVTEKTISGILVFAIFCTLGRFLEMVSLVAMTVLLVLISQCIGVLKFKIEKNVYSRE